MSDEMRFRAPERMPPLPFVALDLESTGLKHGVDRIVQVGVVRLSRDGVERLTTVVNPEIPVPRESTEVHGITDEKARAGPLFAGVAVSMARMFAGATCIVGFNVRRFDVPFLQEELLRVGAEDFTKGIPVLDVMDLDRVLRPRTLDGVFRHWMGVPPEGAHDAGMDALNTLGILAEMCVRGDVDATKPDQLAAWSVPERDRGMLDPHGWFKRREDGVVVMARGKHAGVELGRVPVDYLAWMADAEDLPPRTRRTVEAVLAKRKK